MDRIDAVVVGAGVVGLAIARALALDGHEVVMIEAAGAIGTGASSRNSEVIHAGIYYPPGSLKAQLCIAGREMLYAYCADRGLPANRLGKLIVATEPGQVAKLAAIETGARACGVDDLQSLSAAEACAIESELSCVAALLSPSTGIIDSHALMLSLQSEAEAHGAQIAFSTRVIAGMARGDGVEIEAQSADGSRLVLATNLLVNAAGLGAQSLARAIVGFPEAHVPPLQLARGSYFSLSQRSPFSRLIYPIPVEGGLGVHLTLDMAGAARFGPDVEHIATIDYTIDPSRADSFYSEIRRYWPRLKDGALRPAYAGVRPRLSGHGETPADFCIEGPRAHGIPGLINLFGIESPGLTASLAIAEYVRAIALGAAA